MQGEHRLTRSGPIVASVLALTLGGCAVVPPVVGAIAYGIDGISLIVSGKTTTDHAVSAIAEQDCRLWRLLVLEPVCQPAADSEDSAIAVADAAVQTERAASPAVALAVTAPPAPPPILQPRAKPGAGLWPPTAVEAAAPPRPSAPAPAARVAAPAPPPSAVGERYLVIGTFRQRGNAESLAGRMLDAGAVITDPEPGVGQFHRVVIGPLDTAQLPRLRQTVNARGVKGAWTATLCLNPNAVELPCGVSATDRAAIQTAAVPSSRSAAPVAQIAAQIAARTLTLSTDPIY